MRKATSHNLRIACMISGGGRTMMNLADRIDEGSLTATIELVIASREGIKGVELARDRGFDVRIASMKRLGSEGAIDDAVTEWLREKSIDLVCMCGYLRLMRIDEPFVGKVMNIHPALLPKFGGKGMHGLHVHRAVLAAGERITGCTVHWVDEQYDHGPTILQRTCEVRPDDDEHTLAARVFEEECIAYPEAVRLHAEGKIHIPAASPR
jgi:phosphoribosylglycinamide formyltransferase 1